VSSEIAITVEPVSTQDVALGSQERGEINRDGIVEQWLRKHLNLFAMAVVAAGLVARLSAAAASYLNPDEAVHYLILNQPSVALAYKASLTNAHPPLIYLLVYFWRFLGRSEVMLRVPSVLAGAAMCWVAYKWISLMFGKAAGVIGLVLVSFSPAFIALSAELRSYALLMFFETAALYFAEAALREKSVGKMWYSSIFLYLAILSHYSALFFALAAGVYVLARLAESGASRKVISAWALGQAGAVAIFGFLYLTHVSKIRNSISMWAMPFEQDYFHLGAGNFLTFTRIRTLDFFTYLFENQYTAAGMFLAWTIAVVLLLYKDWKPQQERAGTRFSGVLIIAALYCRMGRRHRWNLSLCRRPPYRVPGSICNRGRELPAGRSVWSEALGRRSHSCAASDSFDHFGKNVRALYHAGKSEPGPDAGRRDLYAPVHSANRFHHDRPAEQRRNFVLFLRLEGNVSGQVERHGTIFRF
jgi:Dolichyl-phosphate-mannose-protein mannosyltransferase